MFWNAKGGIVQVGDTDMDYISFGKGQKTLIMLPGLGDGLKTVKGTATAFAAAYKIYAKDYKVYMFSRKNRLTPGYSTRAMARDTAEAMKNLGIAKADILGVSQGGMVAQFFAIDYPEMVNKLVLAVTLSRQNEMIQNTVNGWIEMAKADHYKGIIIDTAEKSYSEQYIKRYRLLYPLLGRMGKPKSFDRFLIQANACVNHNAYDELEKIKSPVLIIGGDSDQIVGADSAKEIAEKIKNSELFIYRGLGHGAYEEAKDFNKRVLEFLRMKDEIKWKA